MEPVWRMESCKYSREKAFEKYDSFVYDFVQSHNFIRVRR